MPTAIAAGVEAARATIQSTPAGGGARDAGQRGQHTRPLDFGGRPSDGFDALTDNKGKGKGMGQG